VGEPLAVPVGSPVGYPRGAGGGCWSPMAPPARPPPSLFLLLSASPGEPPWVLTMREGMPERFFRQRIAFCQHIL